MLFSYHDLGIGQGSDWTSILSMGGMNLSSGDVQIFFASFCALLQAMQMAMYSNSIYAYLRTVSYTIIDAAVNIVT